MKRTLSIIMALALLVGIISGCASTSASTTTSSTTKDTANVTAAVAATTAAETTAAAAATDKTLTIGMSWAHLDDSLFYAMRDTLEKAMTESATARGYTKVEWIHVVANNDVQKQASDISDLITKKVDLIVSYAIDNKAIQSSIEEARAAGIPFICYDRDADAAGTQPDAFIGLDTLDQAYTAGIALFKQMKTAGVTPTSVISIVGDLSDQNAINRIAGFKKAADEYGVTITQEVPSEWNAEKALSGFSAAFQAHPDCNTVLIASDFIITPVQSVLEKAGKWIPAGQEGHVWVASQDVYPSGLQFIRDGFIDYDTAYDLWNMALGFAPVAFDLVEGKTIANPEVKVTGRVVEKDNVDTIDNLWARAYE
ncbi:MAG: sugar ABC transporter substrate-binding protein [Eubacteriales bacterium]